jgi:glycerol-3-phosphate dehydrogenase (NAD(P)+)
LDETTGYGVIYGPMLAKGLVKGEFGCGSIAVSSASLAKQLVAATKDTNLKLVPSSDIKGVSTCGYLKNVYALGLGIADGLELGFDAKSYLTQVSLREMAKLVVGAGGNKQTVYEPCGVADLITTGFSGLSYNYNTGIKIGQSHPPHLLKSEGIHTIKYLSSQPLAGDTLLLKVLIDIVHQGKSVDSLKQIFA